MGGTTGAHARGSASSSNYDLATGVSSDAAIAIARMSGHRTLFQGRTASGLGARSALHTEIETTPAPTWRRRGATEFVLAVLRNRGGVRHLC